MLILGQQKEKGFTMVELIIVIAIIGVLASIVGANVSGYLGRTKDTSVKSETGQISTAALNYVLENGDSSGFCASEGALSVYRSIKKIGSGYTFHCYDPESSYVAKAHNKNIWVAEVSGSDDLFGSDDIFDDEEGGGTGNASCSSIGWYIYVSGLNSSSGCWCVDFQGIKNGTCGNADACGCSSEVVLNKNILLATLQAIFSSAFPFLSKTFLPF